MRTLLTAFVFTATAAQAQEHVHDAVTASPAHVHQQDAVTAPAGMVHQHEVATDLHLSHEEHQMTHGNLTNWLLMADRFEFTQHDDRDVLQWELQGWIGKDKHKLWIKSEGEHDRDAGDTEEAELQLLYSRAIAPYWDVQAGLRHTDGDAGSVSHAVLGLMGLAPYWFETDAALFLSEAGKWSARLEVEYELRFTQRLILQPRLELNYALSNDNSAGAWQGFNDSSFGLRLRYEFVREIAPYLGVEWWRANGGAASVLQRAGRDDSEARLVAGFRLWY